MTRFSGETVCLVLFATGMFLAIFWSPVSYLSPIFIFLFIYIWKYSRSRHEYIPGLLICGEISYVTAWYASPWIACIIQLAVAGLFLLMLRTTDTRSEKISFIILSGVVVLITFLTDKTNHTFLPVVILILSSGLFILYTISSEYRIKKEYAGDM
jgi:hypothetical protein